MSKSKGNVIDPIDLIDAYGADALRFTLAAMAAQGRDIKLSKQRVEGYRNFGTKLWNAGALRRDERRGPRRGYDPVAARVTVNRWIAGETARVERAVKLALDDYKFNEAAGALYQFVWNVFCDWYLELIKPILSGEDEQAKAETRATAAWVLDQILILLHPFMPFVTEELWQKTAERKTWLIDAAWPSYKGLGDEAPTPRWLGDPLHFGRALGEGRNNVPAGAKIACVLVSANGETRRRAANCGKRDHAAGRGSRPSLSRTRCRRRPPRSCWARRRWRCRSKA